MFQKGLNTFAKRHHVRVWRLAPAWQGQPLWLAAATHGIGTTVSLRPAALTHRIDPQVDRQRDKVVRNLVTGGSVTAFQYLDRPETMRAGGGDRKALRTDHRVAVLVLGPGDSPDVAPLQQETARLAPGLAVRQVRRVTLTLRNYALRDNLVWRAFDAGRLGYWGLRHCFARRAAEGNEPSRQDAP